MQIINSKLPAASIAVKKELYDILKKDANYISQIPERFKGWQSKEQPYFIFEENMLKTIVLELKEKEMNLKQPNKDVVDQCSKIISLLINQKPFLIFVSLTA
jgi:hypothetical protein